MDRIKKFVHWMNCWIGNGTRKMENDGGLRREIMQLGTTYIYAADIQKSVDFYSKLLQEEPQKANDDRWVQFSNKIALYNKSYDAKIIGKEPSERFNQAYIDEFYRDTGTPKNNLVVFNLL